MERDSQSGVKHGGRPSRALRILHVEDDPFVVSAVAAEFSARNWRVRHVGSGEEALALLRSPADYDAALLESELRCGPNGIILCSRIRALSPTLWIALLAVRDTEADRLSGFHAGADDYISRSTGIRELVARFDALARRLAASARRIEWGPLAVDPISDQASVAGTDIRLTPYERRLLLLLLHNMGSVVTHAQIREQVLRTSTTAPSSSTRDLAYSLRRRLGQAGRCIRTVAGVGYELGEPRGPVSAMRDRDVTKT